MKDTCNICNEEFDLSKLYEYRGAIACEKCFDIAKKQTDFERQEIIEESKHKTERFRGLDLTNSKIGKANRKILKADIEIAKKESLRRKKYEGMI